MQLPKGYQIITQIAYWLRKSQDYILIPNLKAFAKQFPGKETQIDTFIKENNIAFGKVPDMIKLTEVSNK